MSSDAFGEDVQYVNIVLPALLDNLYSQVPDYLELLQQRDGANEQYEKELSTRRRQSVSVQRSAEIQRLPETNETNPSAASVTTADVDQRTIEEVGVLAFRSLRHIFSADNRGQVRMATTAALKFTTKTCSLPDQSDGPLPSVRPRTSWAMDLFELISRWAPVQDRFIIIVTVMESLVSGPIAESDLARQLSILSIVSWLLQSSINFIGLSVIDVLVGLMQHMLLLLQLGGKGSSVFPHHQQAFGLQYGARQGPLPASRENVWGQSSGPVVIEISKEPSPLRKRLLEDLKLCIGDLATHVYYLDQVGDMISALFVRLKPSSTSGFTSILAAVEDPNGTVDAIADSANLHERVLTDGYFSFDTARLFALEAVKEILVVANSQRHDGGGAIGRNRVDVSVWEGTQWLLRDPEPIVRKAYVDALLTWLRFEIDKKSFLQVPEPIRPSKSKKTDRDQSESILFAKRVLSNASQKLDVEASDQNSFLQLLHLAIYENAMAYSDSESDILLLHLLLVSLVQKLGVNSLRNCLPMIFRIQDEVQYLANSFSRISLASLVHGFLWAVSQCFGFEHGALGQEIHGEISKRTNNNMWLKSIRVPPVPLAKFDAVETSSPASMTPSESLGLFSSREELVSNIASGYSQSVFSPPTSPHASPQKSFSRPHFRKLSTSTSVPPVDMNLSSKIISQMLEDWTREGCIAAVERDRAISLAGSKSGSGSGQRSFGPPDGRAANGSSGQGEGYVRPGAYGAIGAGPGAIRPQQKLLSNRSSQAPLSDSSARSIMRVEDLKRVLSGNYTGALPAVGRPDQPIDDTISESMVTASISESDSSLPQESNSLGSAAMAQRATVGSFQDASFVTPAATAMEIMREADPLAHDIVITDDDVPPVPMLPANLRAVNIDTPVVSSGSEAPPNTLAGGQRPYQPGTEEDVDGMNSWDRRKPGKVDLRALLDGLDTTTMPPTTVMGAPPY